MDEAIRHIHQVGGAGDVVATFRAVAESERFPGGKVLGQLARIITGAGANANKDAALYELCHLVNAAHAAGFEGSDGRFLFFMGEPVARAAGFETLFQERDFRRSGFAHTRAGVAVDYGESSFQLRYVRMPVLSALYEFLLSMEGCAFYGEMTDILDEMVTGSTALGDIRKAAGRLASRFRKYRHAHIDWAKHEEKFDRLAPFLTENAENGAWIIDDAAVLAFWCLHSTGQEFKGYKTVFEMFVTLLQVLRKGDTAFAVEGANVLGTDFEAGEVNPADTDAGGAFEDWQNPLPLFDRDDLKEIKFFKGESERKPIEGLMRYGPDARRLPLAFLRLESLGRVQAAITNDLQMKRGADSVRRRLDCDDARSYREKGAEFERVLSHLERLKVALWHVVGSDAVGSDTVDAKNVDAANVDAENVNVVALNTTARKTFEGMRRKGFDQNALGDAGKALFREASEAVLRMESETAAMTACMGRLGGLDALFAADKQIFSEQLRRIYGGAL